MFEQPKPDSKKYSDLIHEIQKGIIKIPKFQRDFVWDIDETARLLDSILKGYPIGTFILWQTNERLNEVKNIGNLTLPDTPDGTKVQYVLDGQQRITSLYAAYCGAEIKKKGEKKLTDYKNIFVKISKETDQDEQIIVSSKDESDLKYISLHDVLNFSYSKARELSSRFDESELELVDKYSTIFKTYEFSIVVLRKEDIDSAIEVFTRINTGGEPLTLFEIMSAKTYDEKLEFDMTTKWKDMSETLKEVKYETVSKMNILHLLSLLLSKSKECKRKTILKLNKTDIINNWDKASSAIKASVDYFRTTYRIPVSHLLPYDALIVPFAYFFFKNDEKQPNGEQKKYLEEFFWKSSLSYRYQSATESKLSKDIKRIDNILENKMPDTSDIKVIIENPNTIAEQYFSAGNSFCKAILCVLAYHLPKDFRDNGLVILDNSWLKVANSKNYHHFFPKAFLDKSKNHIYDKNSIANITFISDDLNKRAIRAKSPADYISKFSIENNEIDDALRSHLINNKNDGISNNDYNKFIENRAKSIFDELSKRINRTQ